MANMRVGQRRELLLTAGIRVIARDGLDAASTRAVVAEAEMPLASFHYAFASREDFLAELVSRLIVAPMVPPGSPLAPTPDFTAAVRRLIVLVAENDVERARVRQELALHASHHPGLRALARTGLSRARERVAGRLVEAADQHGMAWRVDPDELAGVITAWARGQVLARVYSSIPIGVPAEDNPAAETLTGLIVSAARPQREDGASVGTASDDLRAVKVDP